MANRLDSSQALTYAGEQSARHAHRTRAGTMQDINAEFAAIIAVSYPCEADDCDESADLCECGNAHCATHPHVN